MAGRVVVLASGSGTLLQSLLDAASTADLGWSVAAVGSDVPESAALGRAAAAGVQTFVRPVRDYPDRGTWDAAVAEALRELEPDLVVSAGFMRILGPAVVDEFDGRIINTHPALLPSFPGAHAVRDALAYGVKVTGCTVHLIDHGVDSGRIIAQEAVVVLDDDDEASLHERIKVIERRLLVATVTRMMRDGAVASD